MYTPLPLAQLGNPLPDEHLLVKAMLEDYPLSSEQSTQAQQQALEWVNTLRSGHGAFLALENLMQEYPITSEEGLALMQLAESVLRVPDSQTLERLIADKLHHHPWLKHTGSTHSLLGRASGLSAWLADQIVVPRTTNPFLKSMLHRLGEPMIRHAVLYAFKQIGHQFVIGEIIQKAIEKTHALQGQRERYSFDMLGEGARTDTQALHHFDAYRNAIQALGENGEENALDDRPSISIKLSALHPRYEWMHYPQSLEELYSRLLILAQEAYYYKLAVTIDAEESDRLELSLLLLERLLKEPSLKNWNSLGLAIQAYGRRILPLVDHLIHLATHYQQRLCVRLVKGAYWDSEIKRSQEMGLADYPVFTQKPYTDLAYLSAARKLLAARKALFPQFATHNALTIAQIIQIAGEDKTGFEFQRLYGMGDRLYPLVRETHSLPCRVYAPVGAFNDLLAYLVRRMLENGSNTSFVHQLSNQAISTDVLLRDPKHFLNSSSFSAHAVIPKPSEIYGAERQNSEGVHLSHPDHLNQIFSTLSSLASPLAATSLINGENAGTLKVTVFSPADRETSLGTALFVEDSSSVHKAFTIAAQHQLSWDLTPVDKRAACLEKAADLFEERRNHLIYLLIQEAGKTLSDAIAEVREAVDFCRYYAAQARLHFSEEGLALAGPTGESNRLVLRGRGVWLCISPWNFPLAIFMGQIAAALVSGNAVIAKPAETTSLIAYTVCQWLYEAGCPHTILHLLLGSGQQLGPALLSAPYLAGVAFTGSTYTARWINQQLAAREGPILPFIAETGGQNAMIIDSTALLEHSCDAVIQSAFHSAGQRCSALRIVWVQEDIAENFIQLLMGAMDTLHVGNPLHYHNDVGPVINAASRDKITAHIKKMSEEAHVLHKVSLTEETNKGYFIAPHLIELKHHEQLKEEIFGPVLHLVRFKAHEWPELLDRIHQTGYGLTFGLQSRIDYRLQHIAQHARAGNIYVNRGMTGAVVGVQPFGGEGLSGTGPKAGGPHYLQRFALERTITVNLTASGGNIALMNQTE